MLSSMTYTEYWTEVKSLAEELAKVDEDERYDRLFETIDGHQFIIYTAYAELVMVHTDHEDAVFDSFGELSGSSWSEVVVRAAFSAMEQDVSEAMGRVEVEDAEE